MERKKKLSRGLNEVADLWLSTPSIRPQPTSEEEYEEGPLDKKGHSQNTESPPKEAREEENLSPSTSHLKSISLLYPESPKVKGLLMVNLALASAKKGYLTCIFDYNAKSTPSTLTNLFRNIHIEENQKDDPESHHQVIKPDGMPDIHLIVNKGETLSGIIQTDLHNDNLTTYIHNHHLQDPIIFLYHPDTLEFISGIKDLSPRIVLVSRPQKESLLIAYAYIKIIIHKYPFIHIWCIMDEVMDIKEGIKAFSFLKGIVKQHLSPAQYELKFLGSLIHDQVFGISMATNFPLVLSEEKSESKASIMQIASNLLKFLVKEE